MKNVKCERAMQYAADSFFYILSFSFFVLNF